MPIILEETNEYVILLFHKTEKVLEKLMASSTFNFNYPSTFTFLLDLSYDFISKNSSYDMKSSDNFVSLLEYPEFLIFLFSHQHSEKYYSILYNCANKFFHKNSFFVFSTHSLYVLSFLINSYKLNIKGIYKYKNLYYVHSSFIDFSILKEFNCFESTVSLEFLYEHSEKIMGDNAVEILNKFYNNF